jgi:hypothetical protein
MAFRFLATSSPSGSEEKNDAVGAFLAQHILGFMARFGEVVNDVQNQYSVIEKIRCIKGVEEMVKIGKMVIRVARPQVGFGIIWKPSQLIFSRSVPFYNRLWLNRSSKLSHFQPGKECFVFSQTTTLN